MKDSFKNEERLKHLVDLLPSGFETHQIMRIMTEYVQSLEETFAEFKKVSASDKRQLEGDWRGLQKKNQDQHQEMERLTTDLLEVANAMDEQESALESASLKISNYEKQFKKIYRENSDLINKSTQKENDASFYRQELERSVRDNEQLTTALQTADLKIEELERKLIDGQGIGVMQEKEMRRLTLVIAESQGKVALTEERMENTVARFNDEIIRLTGRKNIDSKNEMNLLIKRVRAGTAPEMQEFDQLVTGQLSIELAGQLKALVARLVTKLEQAGLELI